MSSGDDVGEFSDWVWLLGLIAPGQGDAKVQISSLDGLTDDEVATWEAANGRLNWVTNKSPFVALERRWRDLEQIVEGGAVEVDASSATTRRFQEACEALDAMLAAARAFSDRTAHRLSTLYGRSSRELHAFRAAQSREYDAQFAYRFCEKLRNYSQHYGQALSNIRASTRLGPDDERISEFVPVFDSEHLLSSGYRRWGSQVRSELERIGGEFAAMPVLERFFMCCMRANAVGILVQERALRESTDVVQALRDRAGEVVGDVVVMRFKPPDTPRGAPQMQIRHLRPEIVGHIDTLLQDCNAFVGAPWPHLPVVALDLES